MKKPGVLILAFLFGGSLAACCSTDSQEECSVRISWDHGAYQEMTEVYVGNKDFVEKDLYYPRIRRLTDGSLFMSFNNHHYGWNVYVRRSEDNGKTWSDAQILRQNHKAVSSVGEDVKVFVNSDFIQLRDGRILLAYQWRYKNGYGDIPNTNNNCGIEVMFSDDMGRTFFGPREVFRGRCWEPAMLQLPSGEIHMYITSSQDVVDGVSYPRTIVIRSFDGGKTWQDKDIATIGDVEPISRTIDDRYAYDGMPSGVWMDDNNGIAVPLEVWHGRLVMDQTPIVVKTSVEENWRLDHRKILDEGGPDYPDKKQVNKDLWGYGPYSTKLGTGEVVVQCNGTYKGVQGIWTLVGDRKADNFRFATSPFDGYWGCIDYIGNNEVIAAATVQYQENGETRGKVVLVKGRLNYDKTVSKGDVPMVRTAAFDRANNDFWFLGKNTGGSVFTDFGYTDDSFIFATYLFDKNIAAYTPENSDASIILLGREGTNGSWKNYKIVVNALGKYTIYKEERYSWVLAGKGATPDVEVSGTVNNSEDEDLGYSAKLAVDWELLGGKPSGKETLRIHLRHHYKTLSSEKPLPVIEDLEGESSDYPQEWLRVTLD